MKTQDNATKGKCPSGLPNMNKQIWKQLYELVQKRPLSLVDWRHVGLLITSYSEEASKKKSVGSMEALGTSLGCAHSELYYAQQLSQEYSKKALEGLQTKGFGWGKMMLVLSISDLKARKKFIEDVIDNQWSTKRLRSEMHQREGYRAKPVSRIRKTPKYVGYEEGLQELLRQCRNWNRYHENVWYGKPTCMASDLEDLPPEEMDESLLELLQSGKAELRKVVKACADLQDRLDATCDIVMGILMGRSQ